MIKLDDDLLKELNLATLPAEEKKKLLAHIYETLEMRVGMKLAEQMTDAQLAEFEQFIDRNDEAGALRWLESNFPNYKDVVAAEFENLKREIAQVAPQILANANQVPLQQPVAPQLSPNQGAWPQQQMPGGNQGAWPPANTQSGTPPQQSNQMPANPWTQNGQHQQPGQYPPQQPPQTY